MIQTQNKWISLALVVVLLPVLILSSNGFAESETPLFSFFLYDNAREISLYESGRLNLIHSGKNENFSLPPEYIEELKTLISQYAPATTGEGTFYLYAADKQYQLTEEEFLDIQNNPETLLPEDAPNASVCNFAKELWKVLLRADFTSILEEFNANTEVSLLFSLRGLNGNQTIDLLSNGDLVMSKQEQSISYHIEERYTNQIRIFIESTPLPEETDNIGDYMLSIADQIHYLNEAEVQDILDNFDKPVPESESKAALRNLVKQIWNEIRQGLESQK